MGQHGSIEMEKGEEKQGREGACVAKENEDATAGWPPKASMARALNKSRKGCSMIEDAWLSMTENVFVIL